MNENKDQIEQAEPVDENDPIQVSFRATIKTRRTLEEMAKKDERSLSMFLDRLVRNFITQSEKG